jgi:hypothetical protein
VVESQKVCIDLPFVGIDSEELNLILVIVLGSLRVESNPGLCGHLNGDVGAFVALIYFHREQILVSCLLQ